MFEKKIIHSLQEINEQDTFHYQFKGIDFLLKSSLQSPTIIIFFHGAVRDKSQIPVFRGFNYEFPNTTILCIADKTLEEYPSISCFWYIHPLYKTIYFDIIQYCSQSKKNIIMTGSSSGCFPAIYYSSLFSAKCLVQNGQIYLEKYYNFWNLLKKISILFPIPCIETTILYFGCPEIIYFQNIKDEHHYEHHCKPFQKFIKDNHLEKNVKFILFEEEQEGKTPHHIHCPRQTTLKNVLETFFFTI